MKDFIYKKVNNNIKELDLKASLYESKVRPSKGILLYFHGGGLLYGNRNDLPDLHIDKLNNSGYSILSFDYRLAPEAEFDLILEDLLDAIEFFIQNKKDLGFENSPYFLWGRSAGAYLALLASTQNLSLKPNGIISYYGYGFITPDWFNTSNMYYLKYPMVTKEQLLNIVKDNFVSQGSINERFSIYVYGRQNGTWLSMISKETEADFLSKYSLSNINIGSDFPPTFLAHSFKDEDVPFRESIELSKIIKNSTLFTCSADGHDFDRQENHKDTLELLDKTLEFLDSNIG